MSEQEASNLAQNEQPGDQPCLPSEHPAAEKPVQEGASGNTPGGDSFQPGDLKQTFESNEENQSEDPFSCILQNLLTRLTLNNSVPTPSENTPQAEYDGSVEVIELLKKLKDLVSKGDMLSKQPNANSAEEMLLHGIVESGEGNFDTALTYFSRCLDICDAISEDDSQVNNGLAELRVNSLNQIGIILCLNKNYYDAAEYFRMAIQEYTANKELLNNIVAKCLEITDKSSIPNPVLESFLLNLRRVEMIDDNELKMHSGWINAEELINRNLQKLMERQLNGELGTSRQFYDEDLEQEFEGEEENQQVREGEEDEEPTKGDLEKDIPAKEEEKRTEVEVGPVACQPTNESPDTDAPKEEGACALPEGEYTDYQESPRIMPVYEMDFDDRYLTHLPPSKEELLGYCTTYLQMMIMGAEMVNKAKENQATSEERADTQENTGTQPSNQEVPEPEPCNQESGQQPVSEPEAGEPGPAE